MAKHREVLDLHAANPLLIPLGQFVENREDWIPILSNDPLKGIDRTILSREQRLGFLGEIGSVFHPTTTSIDFMVDIIDMVRTSYRARNPLIPEVRKKRMQILGYPGDSLTGLPWFNTSIQGKLLDGVTGLGKSHMYSRGLDLIPKTWNHGRIEAAGWLEMKQIVHLYLKMPHDGYRGGLLKAMIAAIDECLGTDYTAVHRGTTKIEPLALIVGQLLVSHFCGLLVLDDLQLTNFTLSPHRREMLVLMLKLLDFGVPVILMGNPLALADIQEFSQNMRRLTSREPVHLFPYEPSNKDWCDGLVPAIWNHDLMPQRTKLTNQIREIVSFHSAGIPDYVQKIRVGSQRAFLQSGKKLIEATDLEKWILNSEAMKEAHALITGFREKDPWLLSTLSDVPWQKYGLMWGKLTVNELHEQEKSIATKKQSSRGDTNREERERMSIQLKMARAFERSQSAKEKKNRANTNVRNVAEKEDWRAMDKSDVMAAGIEALKKKVGSK